MIIGLDLDDVLFDFTPGLHAYHNRFYDTSFELEDFKQNLAEMWGCSKEEERKRIFDFYSSQEHWDSLPVFGAVEGINNLRQHHDITIITAKPEALKDKTLEWLGRHFPQTFEQIHFTNQYHGSGLRRTKGEVCRGLGISIFVDDFIHNAEDVANAGIRTLLFDAPWNQGEINPLVTRVYSWDEITDILNKQ